MRPFIASRDIDFGPPLEFEFGLFCAKLFAQIMASDEDTFEDNNSDLSSLDDKVYKYKGRRKR